jgi:hypothetical protein
MIRKCQLLFCDNEHGTGDVCFPDVGTMTEDKIHQTFIQGNISAIRKEAKKEGWGRVNGGDYCPACMESM